MQLIHYNAIPKDQVIQTFKNASWRSLLWVVVIMGVVTAYTAIPKGEATNPVLIAVPGLATVFFFLLFLWHLHKSRNPRNWLVKATEDGLYINLQSNVNVPPTEGVSPVVFLPVSSITSMHRVHEVRKLPARHGYYKNNFSYFDIVLDGPIPEELVVSLAQIRRNRAIRGAVGFSRDMYTAVRVKDRNTLRIVWDWMTPRELAAAEWFSDRYRVEDLEQTKGPDWESLSPDAQDDYIDMLWEWGDVQDATLQKSMKDTISERQAAIQLSDRLG